MHKVVSEFYHFGIITFLDGNEGSQPKDKSVKFFVNKCLPFGASISCALFQHFSNAVCFLAENRSNAEGAVTNYLDDFLFVAILMSICNAMIADFIKLCEEIGVPISSEKTEWVSKLTVFLGILLNGWTLTLAIPIEKKKRAVDMLSTLLHKRKVTVKQLQSLCGYLNFLTKVIVPGRVFL